MRDATTLSRSDFGAFFAAMNHGRSPFLWQERLVDYIVEHGRWPEQIIAPTGSGKSAVVEVHVFVNALSAAGAGPRVPRRLYTVVNRRALVDSQHDRASYIREELQKAADDGSAPRVLRTMSIALSALRTGETGSDPEAPIAVGLLRGGVPVDNPAVLDPSACTVIGATPDMWGSRLLFRGYGVSWRARPREAAVAAYDSVMVLDESHLNRQLLLTSRRIAELVAAEQNLGIPTLQVVETTATPAEETGACVSVEPGDLDTDTTLADRIRASKPLSLQTSDTWLKQATGKRSNKQYVSEVSDAVLSALQEVKQSNTTESGTVGCIVNRVNTAVDVAALLKRNAPSLNVKILVGRMRPADLQKLRSEHKGLFTITGDPSVDVLIATQTLEVGVDVDFAALVTELASASALTQRFGRVNRLGLRTKAPVTVLLPDQSPNKDCLPYTVTDLTEGITWLRALQEEFADVSPQSLSGVSAPKPSRRRVLYQRPEWTDVNRWSRTGDRLFADDDLDLWLRDDLQPEQAQAGIVVRDGLPVDDLAAAEVLRASPPHPDEEFPAKVSVARDIVDSLLSGNGGRKSVNRAFLVRDGDIIPVRQEDTDWSVRPGDTAIVDYGAKFTTENVAVSSGDASDIPIPVEHSVPRLFAPEQYLHQVAPGHEVEDRPELRREFSGLAPEEATEMWRSLNHSGQEKQIVILPASQPADADEIPWFLVQDSDISADSVIRQEWTESKNPVPLSSHSQDVADRAAEISVTIGLASNYAAEVTAAGMHHDDGKKDLRFQQLLGYLETDSSYYLAKGTGISRRKNKNRSGLPSGWRHEQYSAVLTELARRSGDKGVSNLVVRLVGTSHGHGRNGFPHVGSELLMHDAPDNEATVAEDLFTTGKWDELVELTAQQTGHYAVSYLEAVVRAADNQISKEGH